MNSFQKLCRAIGLFQALFSFPGGSHIINRGAVVEGRVNAMTYTPMYGYCMPNNMSCYSAVSGMQACMDPYACKLKVEGTGTVRVEPDLAVVILGVVTEDTQLANVQKENARRIADILSTLERMGIDKKDIQTQAYTIDPQYDYVEGRQVFRNYRVVHNLSITVRNVAQIGEIIDAAVQSGANTVNSIRFTVSDPSRLYQQALNAAVEDAQFKAATIAGKLNIQVSRVPVQLTELSISNGTPVPKLYIQAAEVSTPVQPGQIEIAARVEATFTYVSY
jgi:uncharacterized protein